MFFGCTEAPFFEKSNTLILGPVPVTAHEPNEFIEVEKYNELIEIYKKVISYLFINHDMHNYANDKVSYDTKLNSYVDAL